MTRDELAQDLAYVRTLAEEGRHAPLLGGAYLLFWGALNAAAYVAHWAILNGFFGQPGMQFAVLWTSYGVVAAVGSGLLGYRSREKPGKSSLGVRTERAIWKGVGLAIGVIVLGSLGRMFVTGDNLAPNGIMGPLLALFGVALSTVGLMAREKWLMGYAAIAYATSIALIAYCNEPWAYLVAAAANAIVLGLPGIILLRREPAAIV